MPRPRRPQPRKSKSRRTVDTSDDNDWYTIRNILDERLVKGRVEYLVDWDDNQKTGEAYSPTWSREVTDAARNEWEQRKRSRVTEATEVRTQDSQDSQPPRPSNWRHLQRPQTAGPSGASRRRRSPSDGVDTHRPAKVAKVAHSATPSEEPVPSIVSISSPDSLDDPDGLDRLTQQSLNASRSQQLVVELEAKSDFDTSEYASQHNTQSSSQSSQPIAELEEQDERSLFASQLSRQTIPDSQEPSGQTWTQDKQVTSLAPSLQASQGGISEHEPQIYSWAQASSQRAGHNEEPPTSSHRDSSNYRDEEKRDRDQSNSNIPSHQPAQEEAQSLVASQDFDPRAHATKPQSVQSPQGNKNLAAIPTISPVFLSQVVAAELNLPSSSISSQESPHKSVVVETPSDTRHNSASTHPLTTDLAAEFRDQSQGESQDAQVLQIDPFVSHVRAFSVSHDTAHASPTLSPPKIDSQSSPEPPFAIAMENHSSANPTPQPSAVDELSQILNLDKVMAEGPSHPPEEHSAEHSTPAEIPATNPSIQDHDQQPSSAEHESAGPQSEQLALDTPLVSRISAVVSMKSIVDAIFAHPDLPASSTMMLDALHNPQPELSTVSPADISKQPDLAAPLPLMPSLLTHDNLSSNATRSSGVSVPMGQPQQDQESSDDSGDESQEPITLRHIITLPFQASLRPLYDDTLLESKREINCVCEEIGKSRSEFTSIARVTLILPGKNVEEDDFDIVIGYDHSFGGSEIQKKLEPEIPEARSPMVLILVTTHSIEHIDLYISDDLTPLERKNALMSGIVRSRHLVSDPDRGYSEPHEIASLFLDYLNGQTEEITWKPIPVPEDVMDIYLNSQSRSQMPVEGTPELENARKRKLDDSDDEDVKRMRILPHRQSTVQTNEAPVPDDVKALLDSANIENTPLKASHVHISVPISVLQVLAEKNNELKRQLEAADRDAEYKSLISGLEARIKEYQRTNERVYSSQREALEDRIRFERETRKAESNLVQANETAQRDAERAQKKIADLEATVARLTADPSHPDEPSPLSKTQTLLQESLGKIAMLEKRLENAHKDADYARSLYQDATATSSALRGENADLSEQVAELSKKTPETLGKVHEIQADATVKTYLHQIQGLRTQLRERELELDYTKEELRTLRNGRRETRQVSVPRSPRMGVMSPRTGRATYGSAGGSTSRGTSPAPTNVEGAGVLAGMQFLGQPANGRWQHLRD
ncbi:hypothetical protein E5D57_003932 [Metarhizium anisopliae]|nr:hypothetical protein E5D57_003932 [Metarhizium anisopliae]